MKNPYDAAKEDPIGPAYGPRRRAPQYYAGETYGGRLRVGAKYHKGRLAKGAGRPIQYPDVERLPNGKIPGIRNKAARRLIRAALKRKFSKVESALALPRAMKAQAREIARSANKGNRWAMKLFEKELAIHQEVYVPSKKEIRRMRTEKRKAKRAGKLDAIAQLVDKMAAKP